MKIMKILIRVIHFQPLFQKVDLCENGNEEIVYDMLWQGEAYTPEMAKMAQSAKEKNLNNWWIFFISSFVPSANNLCFFQFFIKFF